MRKFLILIAASLVMLSSCSNVATKSSESSVPKAEAEVWGVDESDSETVPESEPITLTYAIIGEILPEEKELIEQFNEADNGYVIETRDYSSYCAHDENGNMIFDEEKGKALDIVLTQDIANGEIDVFRDYYLNGADKMDMLAAKGAFVDLYSLMENDPDVNSSTLNEHILQLHETEGKLYMLPTYYRIDTLIGETRYVGDKENWTLDEFISHWEQMPEGAKINGHTEKDYVYMTILRSMVDTFIDYENAAVHFDSPEFIRALEYCNTFDDITGYTEYDKNAVEFVINRGIDSFSGFHTSTLWNEGNQPITLVGFPSDSGSGALINTGGNRMAISSMISEEKQQGAWEFIKQYAMEEYQTEYYCEFQTTKINGEAKQTPCNFKGFPMNLNAYNKIAKEAMEGKYNDKVVSFNGIEHEVGWLTQDELDRLTNYINSIQNLSVAMDNDLWQIINDEIMAYFRGEKTVEETVEIIQNRASIMVSERQ